MNLTNYYLCQFSVSTVKQVIALLNQIHSMKCEGLSVWAVLRKLQKDRKTIDRFKHIYYLQNLDAERLKQVCYKYVSSMSICK